LCEKDSMEPLEDEVSIWSSERVGLEIVLQICSSQITVKICTAIFNNPLTFVLYSVDTVSDIKELVCNQIPWWKEVAKSKEFDLSLVLYSFYSRKYTNDGLKIDDTDDEYMT
jgi:hypothetical protein